MKSDKYLGLLSLLLAGILGGAVTPGIIRTGVKTIHPVVFTFFIFLISSIILVFISFKHWKNLKPQNKEISLATLLLGLSMTGNTILFSLGVPHTTLIVSQLMYSILPITTGIVGFLWFKEKIPTQKMFGAVVAITGVASLIIFSQKSSEKLSLGTMYGNIMILGAVFSYTMFMVFSKKYSKKYPIIILSTISNLGASLVTLPFASYFLLKEGVSNISTESWFSAIAIGIISAGFIFLIQFGLKRLSTVTSAIIAQLNPEFAALTGILFYHEKISLILIISLLLVSGGAFLSVQTEQMSLWQKLISKFKA